MKKQTKQSAPELLLDKDGVHKPFLAQDQLPFNDSDFLKSLKISVNSSSQQSISFDISGIDASIANALRRIMIAQIPTMALHKVFMYQNTSVLPDQVLIHRIGLMPLRVDYRGNFQDKKDDDELDESNSLKFKLSVKCTKKKEYEKFSDEVLEEKGLTPEQYLQNANVYAKDMEWIPQGNQKSNFPKGVSFVHPDILITKLRQNQQIQLQIWAQKGIGRVHTKWSPVSTAFYRLLPSIKLLPTFDHSKDAEKLVACCPKDVFAMKGDKAIVKTPKNCTTCRECIKLDGVQLGKVQNNFIFTVESTGVYAPAEIFIMALDLLSEKAKSYMFD